MRIASPRAETDSNDRLDECRRAIAPAFILFVCENEEAFIDMDEVKKSITHMALHSGWQRGEIELSLNRLAKPLRSRGVH